MSQDPFAALAREVRSAAAELAGRLSARARGSASIAQERAILRMLGVDGLDRAGHPLASSVAEAYCGTDSRRLAGGILLPFAVAQLEYELPPRELGLDIAAGVIDLGLEAELLARPDRLTAARKQARTLLGGAVARIDANRTAGRDLRDVLGTAPQPWLGLTLQAVDAGPAAEEVKELVRCGADLVRVEVPSSWELAEARRRARAELQAATRRAVQAAVRGAAQAAAAQNARRWFRGEGSRQSPARSGQDPVPAGSQRGLAGLRTAADQAAAERGCYAGVMTFTSALAAPEQAAVAAFERIDVVEADPIREIVEHNVDPDRALADHAFAHRLHAHAGTAVVIGAGPLAIGADIASGVPAQATTSAGRALALEALGVEFALADGLAASRLLAGAIPSWLAQEQDPAASLVHIRARSLVLPDIRLVIEEPRTEAGMGLRTASLLAALSAAPVALVLWDTTRGGVTEAAAAHRAAAATGAALRAGLGNGELGGAAAENTSRILRAALTALEELSLHGWESLLGPSGRGSESARFGAAAVVERASGADSAGRLLADLL